VKIARVFPRRTNATPTDTLSFTTGPGLFPPEVDEVHVSVTFTYDLPRAEQLATEWRSVAPVVVGGPACGTVGGEFEPGKYLKDGYVITSRGCPNRCWFCNVWRRDGTVRELGIRDGWNVLDDNLLACSDDHVRNVLQMLARQSHRPRFTGGLEAARMQPWHAQALRDLRPERLYMAYDEPSDWEPLVSAAALLWASGMTAASHVVCAYVLCGWPRDTMQDANVRMQKCLTIGVTPYAMLWRDTQGRTDRTWRAFQRSWVRPHIIWGDPLTTSDRAPNLFDEPWCTTA
jgi:hypothetical protein